MMTDLEPGLNVSKTDYFADFPNYSSMIMYRIVKMEKIYAFVRKGEVKLQFGNLITNFKALTVFHQ